MSGHIHGNTREVYVDPARKHIPLRYSILKNGETVIQIDFIQYEQKDKNLIPVSWKITQVDPSDRLIKTSLLAKLQESSINLPFSPSEFQLEFPPGTWVKDRRNKESGYFHEHLVLSDGERTPIPLADRTKPIDQLLSERSKRGHVVLYGVLLLLAFIVAAEAARRYYKTRRTNEVR